MNQYRYVPTGIAQQTYGPVGVTGGAPRAYAPPDFGSATINLDPADAVLPTTVMPPRRPPGRDWGAPFRAAGDTLGNITSGFWRKPAAGAKGLAALGGMTRGGALGMGGIAALLGAAGEFGDAQDPAGNAGNAVDAGGNLLGSALAGGAVMAPALLAGGPIGIGTLALASLAAAVGGQGGKAAARGISDAIGMTTSDPFKKDLDRAIRTRLAEAYAEKERMELMQPVLARNAEIDLALNKRRAEAQQQLVMNDRMQQAMLSHMLGGDARTANYLANSLTV